MTSIAVFMDFFGYNHAK